MLPSQSSLNRGLYDGVNYCRLLLLRQGLIRLRSGSCRRPRHTPLALREPVLLCLHCSQALRPRFTFRCSSTPGIFTRISETFATGCSTPDPSAVSSKITFFLNDSEVLVTEPDGKLRFYQAPCTPSLIPFSRQR
jgi:hypothetical protein